MGRPKKTDQQKLFESRCREKLSTRGWEILRDMLELGDRQDKQFALKTMLEYGYLAPAKNVDIVEHEPTDERNDGDIAGEIEAVIAGAKGKAQVQPGSPEAPEGT